MRYVLLTLFLTLCYVAPAQDAPRRSAGAVDSPVGIQLYSFRDQFKTDVPGTMAKVRKMGFREVELAGTYGLSVPDFKALLAKNGLKAIGTGVDFRLLETDVPKVIAEAKALGVPYVVCFWIPHDGDTFTQADANRAIETFNTAGQLLANAGLKFCYHLHGYEFQPFQNATYFEYLADNLDPRYVNFEMDVFWVAAPGGDPIALLQKYPKRFPLVHLKDRQPGTPRSMNGHLPVETNVVLGQGDIGIADFMRAARKAGVKHFFIEDESPRAIEQVPQSVAFLRTVK